MRTVHCSKLFTDRPPTNRGWWFFYENQKLGAWLSTMTEETNVDIVAEKVTPAPMEDVATTAAVRRMYEDDRAESGLLDL